MDEKKAINWPIMVGIICASVVIGSAIAGASVVFGVYNRDNKVECIAKVIAAGIPADKAARTCK